MKMYTAGLSLAGVLHDAAEFCSGGRAYCMTAAVSFGIRAKGSMAVVFNDMFSS